MSFAGDHLLGLDGLAREEIEYLLESAESFREISAREIKKVPTLRGKTVVGLFFEPSTRTRTSFEIAAKRLSADFVSISGSTSSATKGETLLDTARNVAAMNPDCLVMRHGSSGAPHLLAAEVGCPVINAGDGAHEHPTQALLDMLTIRDKVGRIEGLDVAIVGDILHSRVARSNIHALRALGARVRLIGPPTFLPPVARHWGEVHHDMAAGLRDVDVVMMLRLQRERQGANFLPSLDEYSRYFCLNAERLQLAKPGAIVLHPGPINRGIEIASEVADGASSVILDQVTNGVAVRMACLYILAGRARVAAVEERQVV